MSISFKKNVIVFHAFNGLFNIIVGLFFYFLFFFMYKTLSQLFEVEECCGTL